MDKEQRTSGGPQIAEDEVVMEQWVVYDHPRDCPDKFVLRRWVITRGHGPAPTAEMRTADTLDEIRALVPWGCVCLTRNEDDDPVIVEVWL